MAQQLKGYGFKQEDGDYELDFVVRSYTDPDQRVAVTAVIHDDDNHERVFTESEVRAIVERIGRSNVLPEALYSWSVHVAKEAGVSFDPA